MKIRLFVNLKVDDQTWIAGEYDSKVISFPQKLMDEVNAHKKGKQPRTVLRIIEDETPSPKKQQSKTTKQRKNRSSSKNTASKT